MNRRITRTVKALCLLALALVLISSLASTSDVKVYKSEVLKGIREKFKAFYSQAQQDRLYMQTDKPFYKPGETIWFTAYVRDAETLKPSENSDIIHIELITPKGTTERHYKIVAKDGAARGDFDLSGHPGGIYKIKAYTEWQKNQDSALVFEKEITVQSVVMPRLKMKLDFEKKAYGKGDEVVAKLELNTNANAPLTGTMVKFSAQLAGTDLTRDSAITDAEGKVKLRFKLPADLHTIDGTVNALIDFEGSTESVSRSIPIVLNKISLEFFPEGGDMVCKSNNHVAFRAINEFGKPADVEGIIVDSKGAFVAQFSSSHFGMGLVDLIPRANETYRARITKPAGILDEFDLPEALDAGYVLSVAGHSENAITLSVQSFQQTELSYVAQTRGKIYAAGTFKAVKGDNLIPISTTDFPIGISQITLFDSLGIERCERLVFVHKDKQLKIKVSTDKNFYKPREPVNMDIQVTDSKGLPVRGNFSLSVVDDNLLSFADDRQGNILSKILLEPELKQKVEEPNFYFDAKEATADKSLDMLLLTSGWRHYVWKQIMNGDFPSSKHIGEKAEIGGIVYEASSRKPMAGAVIRLSYGSRSVITGPDGRFNFNAVDISKGENIEAIAPYYQEQTRRVNQYGKSNEFYLRNNEEPLSMYDEAMSGKMNYQAVLHDSLGLPFAANHKVAVHFKIHAGAPSGKIIFDETDTTATNIFGIIKTYIGQRKRLNTGSQFKGDRYLEVEVDPIGGNKYKKSGTSQLLANPIVFVDSVLPAVIVTGSRYERKLSQETVSMDVVAVTAYKKPLVDHGDTKIEQSISQVDIKAIPTPLRGENKAAQAAGVRQDEVQYIVNGHRAMANSVNSTGLSLNRKINEADMANIADMAPDPNRLDLSAPEVAAKYVDNRGAALADFQKKADAEGKQVVFYRAKEFPAPKYIPTDTTRNDFASTVYWNGNIVTDEKGRAKLSFTTNDLISSFKATLEGFGRDGSVGRAEYNFSTGLPFAMDAKIPVELVSGDKMMVPVFLKNATASDITGKLMVAASPQLQLEPGDKDILLAAKSSKVMYVPATATNEVGEGKLEIKFISEKYTDAISRSITVVAKGFPASISFSGQDLNKKITIDPENIVYGSMKISFTAYPNIMGELMSGVASILREPSGCFEQTSSSNYPNILALQYLKTMQVQDKDMEAKALNLLEKGYKKLAIYETKENGFEWWGSVPPHEALTAYGLMEFADMKNVYSGVDQSMIDRTANLLLARKDGEGGFKKNPKALDAFGKADADVTNAYIVYALSETGYKDNIRKELDEVYKNAKTGDDPYVMALCANALFNASDKVRGQEMVDRIMELRSEGGFWTGKKHSITRSMGQGLKVETSSLVLMALMKSPKPNIDAITGTVKFLVGARSGQGGFGSTQATILALKVLTRYAEFSAKTDEAGTVDVYVNGILAGTKDYAKGERNNIVIDGIEKYIREAKQNIEVTFKGCTKALPYAMNISYSTTVPSSAKECPIDISTRLSAREVRVGETARLSVSVKNKTSDGQPMTMAIIGLPAGFSAQPWQLKEMQEKGVIDFYEINGNNIAFYYRSLAPNAEKQINLDLKAEVPGEYEAPASSAYLYYTNELKNWVGSDRVRVKPM